jgi:hypothetical protein
LRFGLVALGLVFCASFSYAAEPLQIVDNPKAYAVAAGAVAASTTSPWPFFQSLVAGEAPELDLWTVETAMASPKRRISIGASTLFLNGFGPHPFPAALTGLAASRAGEHFRCWVLVDPDQFRPIPTDLLGMVRDHRGMPSPASGDAELDAYAAFVQRASRTSDAAFRKRAKELEHRLAVKSPAECRGKVYLIKGQLIRLREIGLDSITRQTGARHMYEAWIDQNLYGVAPLCVLFTNLPAGLTPSEKYKDTTVQFAGYFYKLYRYEPANPEKPSKQAPLLIGRTISVENAPAAARDQIELPQAMRLPPELLARIRDRRGVPTEESGDPELDAYAEFLKRANATSDDAFRQAAGDGELNRAIAVEAPEKCRGNVYRIKGKLKRLRELELGDLARQAGVQHLYEAWIDQEMYGAHPTCVRFTEFPSGWTLDDKYEDSPVEFAGYFYKLYRYESAAPKKPLMDTPMLIGHTIRISNPPDHGSEFGWLRQLIPIFIGLLCVVIASILGMTLWYRYADEKVRRRISQVRHQEFVPPPEDESSPATESPAENELPKKELPLEDPKRE